MTRESILFGSYIKVSNQPKYNIQTPTLTQQLVNFIKKLITKKETK